MMTIMAIIAATINFNCGCRKRENVSYMIVYVHKDNIEMLVCPTLHCCHHAFRLSLVELCLN